MAGWLTNGLPLASTANGTFPFTGLEQLPLDSELPNGESPQTFAATTGQLLGIVPSTGPYNTPYAATATINGANGQIQTVGTLTGAITLSWTNITPGLMYRIKLVQDASGSRAATLTGGSTTWKVTGSQSTTANYIDWLVFWFDGTTYWGIWNTHFA